MKKISQLAAVVALGAACAMPVMAQDTSGTQASQPATATSSADTSTMGAGPDAMDSRPMDTDTDRDMGWIGLLGLAGLLGLRRRHDRHDHVDTRRTGTVR